VSLINDALRKARQAAAEHEAQQPDTTFRAPKAYPSRGPRRRSGGVVLVVVAVMAGLAGAAVAWWAVEQREQPVAAVVPTRTPSPTPTLEAPRLETSMVVPVETAEETAVVVAATPRVVPPSIEIAPEPAPEPATQKQTAKAGGTRIFILDADLGYATLSLDYIVARPDNPFAEINGVEVIVGSEVEGFRVEKIEANRVVLRDEKGELVLRVP